MAKISKAQINCVARYNAKTYDSINLRVKKGFRDTLKQYTAERGCSVNDFINKAIKEKMDREN